MVSRHGAHCENAIRPPPQSKRIRRFAIHGATRTRAPAPARINGAPEIRRASIVIALCAIAKYSFNIAHPFFSATKISSEIHAHRAELVDRLVSTQRQNFLSAVRSRRWYRQSGQAARPISKWYRRRHWPEMVSKTSLAGRIWRTCNISDLTARRGDDVARRRQFGAISSSHSRAPLRP
jgi:hypothetical protein